MASKRAGDLTEGDVLSVGRSGNTAPVLSAATTDGGTTLTVQVGSDVELNLADKPKQAEEA